MIRTLVVTSLAFAAIGCSDFNSKQDEVGGEDTTRLLSENLGCVQGTVIDGLSRQGVDLNALTYDAGAGIRAMVGGTAVLANPTADFLGRGDRTTGEYSLCNVPLDEQYNLIVDFPGYQRVEGLFLIESTLPNRASKPNKEELVKRVPTEIINIVVYPIGVSTGDLTFNVTHEGKALKGARVQLLQTGQNKLDAANNHQLIYTNVKSLPLAVETDEGGKSLFKADGLVLGATYQYRVFPPIGANERGFAEGQFTLGLVGNEAKGQPYIVHVELNEIAPALKVVSTNSLLAANGQADLELIFNRPVAQLFDTADELTAKLANEKQAELIANIPGNGESEQAIVEVNGNRVVLKAKFKKAPDGKVEPALEVQYVGLRVKATDDAGTLATWQMKDPMAVKVFGGVNQAVIPTTLALAPNASGDGQTGPADLELREPLQVLVADQFGKPMPTTKVTFEAATGNGTLRSGTPNEQKVEVLTGADGIARIYWRLPVYSGSYSVTATLGELAPVKFSATATDWVKQLTSSAVPTTAPAASEVPAFTIQLYDQAGRQWKTATEVLVTAGANSGKVREYTTTPDTAARTLRMATNADGRLTLVWFLGDVAGNHTLTVSVPGTVASKEYTVAATNRFESLVVKAAATTVAVNADAAFSLELRDQTGQPLKPADAALKVRFTLEVGTGQIRGINDASGTGANVFDVVPTAAGLAEVKFKPTEVGTGQFRIVATFTANGITRTLTMQGTVTAAP